MRRTQLFEAINAARYSRQTLIRDIEQQTGNVLLCMVSEHGQIGRPHATAIVDLIHTVTDGTNIDLLLNSPGGDIDTAEKLITLVRKKAGSGAVRVIVPDYAKTAGTLIALGADAIVMSNTSELGPIPRSRCPTPSTTPPHLRHQVWSAILLAAGFTAPSTCNRNARRGRGIGRDDPAQLTTF